MKAYHFLTTLKGLFFSFILLSFVVGCSKKTEEEEKPTAPTAQFSFTPINPKVNEAVTFNNTSTNATTFVWSATGINFNSTDKNPTFTFTSVGSFEIKLVATGEGGSVTVTKQISIAPADTNIPVPVAAFSFSPASPKVGEEVTFTNTSTNATSYQWSAAGTSFSSTAQNPKFTFATAGNFDIKLVAKNATGTNELTKKVTVSAVAQTPAPVAAFTFLPASPKTGEEVTFTNTSTNATSYQWSAVGTSFSSTAQNPKFTFSTAGDFDVKLVATSSAGTNEIIKRVTVTAASGGGGNTNPCNLPECYVTKTTSATAGGNITVNYGYTVVNGTKKISQISTSTGFGNIVTTIQYDAQGRRSRDESRFAGTLSNYIEYQYSNNNRTVRANSYDAAGTLTGYQIDTYDTNMRLTRSDSYTPAGALTGYAVLSDFINTTGTFPQLVETFDANGTLTQRDRHTYQNCQLIKTVSTNGSGAVIGEINNTIDARGLLRTSVANIAGGTSTTQYVYDCD
jgi:PKD repeat protein